MIARRSLLMAASPRANSGRALVALGCGVIAVGATGCESSEQESASIARTAQHSTAPSKLELGALSRDVRASDVTLIQGAESAAVAVHLTSTDSRALADVPIAINVRSASGSLLYTNETAGLEAPLQHMQLLPGGGGGWWVDNQVLGVKGKARVHVSVGTAGSSPAKSVPQVSASGFKVENQSGEHVLTGVLSNHSTAAQSKLPVYAVALKGATVTAAGSGVVESVPAGASKVPFQIFLVGNPAGAHLDVTVAPATNATNATKQGASK
jgi:hypothetical protein